MSLLITIWKWHPPVGVFIGVLAVLGVLVPFVREKVDRREKASWTLVMFLLLGLEMKSIYQDRNEHDRQQAEARREQLEGFREIARGIDASIVNGRQQFDATMRHMEGIVQTNTDILTQQNRHLSQTIGGSGYPVFLPAFPAISVSPNETVFPVKVIYHPHSPSPQLPLIDVKVDLMLRPSKGERIEDYLIATPVIKEMTSSIFHPKHYDLGNIPPGQMYESPLQLQAGRRYQLTITTRRGMFYENINIDPAVNEMAGWKISWCIYQYGSGKRLEGECN